MVSGRVLLLHLSLNTAGHASREEDSPPLPPRLKSRADVDEGGWGEGEGGEGPGESNAGGTLLAVGVRARLRNWG